MSAKKLCLSVTWVVLSGRFHFEIAVYDLYVVMHHLMIMKCSFLIDSVTIQFYSSDALPNTGVTWLLNFASHFHPGLSIHPQFFQMLPEVCLVIKNLSHPYFATKWLVERGSPVQKFQISSHTADEQLPSWCPLEERIIWKWNYEG